VSARHPRRWLVLGALATLLPVVAAATLIARSRQRVGRDRRARVRAAEAGRTVVVAIVGWSKPERVLHLLGEARPFAEVTLYAKVSGYLRDVLVDKGDRVRARQLVATIESPELDQQERAAAADAWSKQRVAGRTAELVRRKLVAQQDADLAVGAARQAEQLRRSLASQRSYQVLRAPFDGVVVARYADPGALLQSATSSQASALPVVSIARSERLRVFAYVDQRDAASVRSGQLVVLTAFSAGADRLAGTIRRTAGVLDPRTRTLLVEVDFDNRDHKILAGSFVDVELHVPSRRYAVVPAEALVLRAERTLVAVVGPDGRVHYRGVTLADQDGLSLWIAAGVREGERVALGVGESLDEGQLVRPIEPRPGR
jgi:RND family efflux transporter MFP subunit